MKHVKRFFQWAAVFLVCLIALFIYLVVTCGNQIGD